MISLYLTQYKADYYFANELRGWRKDYAVTLPRAIWLPRVCLLLWQTVVWVFDWHAIFATVAVSTPASNKLLTNILRKSCGVKNLTPSPLIGSLVWMGALGNASHLT